MSEYIITDKQFKTATEAYLEHELSLPITEVFISGDKLPEIVRCRDCRYYDQNDEPSEVYPDRYLCDLMANFLHPDGFCAWGEKASNFTTCKCGEDIETNGRESVTCPSCGRVIRV